MCVGWAAARAALERSTPEGLLAELGQSCEVFGRVLGARPSVYGQFGGSYSPLLPQARGGTGTVGGAVFGV